MWGISQAISDDAASPLQREDSDKIGELMYFPPNGTFNLMYYPYYGKKAQVSMAANDSSSEMMKDVRTDV